MRRCLSALLLLLAFTGPVAATDRDPHAWLEAVSSKKALGWVRRNNTVTVKALAATKAFTDLTDKLRGILDQPARIPYISKHGAYFYNLRPRRAASLAPSSPRRASSTCGGTPSFSPVRAG